MTQINFIEVTIDDEYKIAKIYEILKISGEHLYKSKGLLHWRNPYPIESIKDNIKNRKVYVVKDVSKDEFIHTFQLEIKESKKSSNISINEKTAEINKFATLPGNEGKGIGTQSLGFIKKYCEENNIHLLFLEVYDQSIDAIRFYESNGFEIKGERKTRHFNVLQMEKIIHKINDNVKD